jgi:hypothetical protein
MSPEQRKAQIDLLLARRDSEELEGKKDSGLSSLQIDDDSTIEKVDDAPST